MSEQRREEEAEKMLLMFTTPYATCGGMRLLEFAAKFGEHEALGVLCRQYGWDAAKLPSPASPIVTPELSSPTVKVSAGLSAEEEAEAFATNERGIDPEIQEAWLAGYSRGGEVEREKGGNKDVGFDAFTDEDIEVCVAFRNKRPRENPETVESFRAGLTPYIPESSVAGLVEALEWYADRSLHNGRRSHPENYSTDLQWDSGARAREALSSYRAKRGE